MKETQKKISPHLRQRVREWFQKAEHEMAYLAHAPLDLEDPPTDTTGRLAHMVAEYCLKGYLVLNKKKIKKIHDLGTILDSCIAVHQDGDFESLREDCRILTRFKIEFAYPGHSPEAISVEEARAAIELARGVYAFVQRKAQELGYTPN